GHPSALATEALEARPRRPLDVQRRCGALGEGLELRGKILPGENEALQLRRRYLRLATAGRDEKRAGKGDYAGTQEVSHSGPSSPRPGPCSGILCPVRTKLS